MSDTSQLRFRQIRPGFDFLQNLAKGASSSIPQMPNLSNWVAPTLNVEELEKRIEELKAVHFWLEQNSRALGATIQALEVQKMTLATLKGMNFNMGDVANAFKLKAAESVAYGRAACHRTCRIHRQDHFRCGTRARGTGQARRAKRQAANRCWRAWWTRCSCGVRSPSSSSRLPPAP
jgi:hypothetical protein